jgi:hypothetical protein
MPFGSIIMGHFLMFELNWIMTIIMLIIMNVVIVIMTGYNDHYNACFGVHYNGFAVSL